MTLKKAVSAGFSGLGILVLILDGQTALTGASAGMDLCIKSVIPSLFPFLFLCSLLTDSLWGSKMGLLRIPGKKLGVPAGAESLLMIALLGGYPAGAAAVADSCRRGALTRQDSEHLLTFCSNAGPAFLFGMTARQFPDRQWILAVWAILILSVFLTGRVFSPGVPPPTPLPSAKSSVSRILNRSVKTMGIICGWVVLFRILTEFLSRWIGWYFSPEIWVLFTGLLELSNGCCSLSAIGDIRMRFLIGTVIHAFGGICVTMQTASVISGLPLKPYLLGKLLQTLLSLVLCIAFLRFGWPVLGLIGAGILLFPAKSKKAVDFPQNCVYNADITTGRKLYAVSKKD